MDNILETVSQMRWVELISVIAAVIYVILAARNNIWCWFFGIISAILWTYAAAVYYKLYVDAVLQIYYVVMGVYGWYMWSKIKGDRRGATTKNVLPVTRMTNQQHIQIIVGGLVLTVIVGYFFSTYTDAAATYLDAFTTVFSIITTVMVTRKVLENWLYWIVIDATYVYFIWNSWRHFVCCVKCDLYCNCNNGLFELEERIGKIIRSLKWKSRLKK